MPWLKNSVVGKIYSAWSEYWEAFKGFMPRGGAEGLVVKCVIVIFKTGCRFGKCNQLVLLRPMPPPWNKQLEVGGKFRTLCRLPAFFDSVC